MKIDGLLTNDFSIEPRWCPCVGGCFNSCTNACTACTGQCTNCTGCSFSAMTLPPN